jgi:hypothetical protein
MQCSTCVCDYRGSGDARLEDICVFDASDKLARFSTVLTRTGCKARLCARIGINIARCDDAAMS